MPVDDFYTALQRHNGTAPMAWFATALNNLGPHPDPLGLSKTLSRFSDLRRRLSSNRFGVLYLGDTVKVCFLEAVLRDRRDGAIGDLYLLTEAPKHRLEKTC